MVSQRQMDIVQSYVARGMADGARLIKGGPGRPDHLPHGWFVKTTLFADVDPNAVIAQDEIFGPVLSVIAFKDEQEAISIANNSRYGLNGAVFSNDVDRALRLATQINTGVMEINGNGAGFTAPIGGVKESGLGREAGQEGFDSYFEYRSIGLPQGYSPP